MKALKIVLAAFVIVVGLSASAFAYIVGSDLCWNMDDGKSNEVYFLRVGAVMFDGGHYSLSGSKTVTTRAGATTSTQLVSGDLESTGSGYMMSLGVMGPLVPNTTSLLVEDVHFMLDATFTGYYYRVNSSEAKFSGMAMPAICP
ncbi:hypothetical protein [Candidatus Magnetominusculus dajiuhuensis]|uniref:hypothetical protein n=1 Tax=Candidatus Magnetominusculus dajiuhuensis TaxID=3137712 RepID=UPI003B42CA70